jgi:hypothetical protein
MKMTMARFANIINVKCISMKQSALLSIFRLSVLVVLSLPAYSQRREMRKIKRDG